MKDRAWRVLVLASLLALLRVIPSSAASAEDAKDKSEHVGPVRFPIPSDWEVDVREEEAVRLRFKDEKDLRRFIMVSRHPGFGAMGYPYTPEGVNTGVIRVGGFDRFPHKTQKITIGKQRRSAVWTGSSRGDVGMTMEHVYVAARGGVYQIHTGYPKDDKETRKAFEQVLQSVEFDDAK